VRTIALRENRTPANVLENAVRVFTLIPQDLRNLLIETSADQMKGARKIEELSRRIMFSLARERFEQAAAVVGHGRRARALTVFVQLLSMPCEFTAVTAT